MLALPRFFFFSLEMSFCSWGSSGVCPLHGLHSSAAGCSGFSYAMRPAKRTCIRAKLGLKGCPPGRFQLRQPPDKLAFLAIPASIPGLCAQLCLFLLSHSASLRFPCRNVHPGK